MPYPCFKCDVELVAGARYCHQCGAPNFLQGSGRKGREPQAVVEDEERYRIKRDIQDAATMPTGTRMIQTVLPPPPPRPRTPIKPKGLGERLVESRFWTRPTLWVALALLVFLGLSSTIIIDLKERLQDSGEVSRALTRLAARCPKDSKPQLMAWMERIQKAAAGTRSMADAATLLEIVVDELSPTEGSCARIAASLAKPDRFAPLAP